MTTDEFESEAQISIFLGLLTIFYLIISILYREKLYKKEPLNNYFGTINCLAAFMIIMLFILIIFFQVNAYNINDYIDFIELLVNHFISTIILGIILTNSIPFVIILLILCIILIIKTYKYFKIKSFLYYFAPVFLTAFFLLYTVNYFNRHYGDYSEMKLENSSQNNETIKEEKTIEKTEWWREE